MKNPNGYGSVIKLSGKRRRPFAARITVGYEDNGKQIYKYLGYYETRKEAMQELSLYSANPYDIDLKSLTMQDIYDRYVKTQKGKVGEGRMEAYRSAYTHLTPLLNMKMADIKTVHLQNLVDSMMEKVSTGTIRQTRSVISSLFKYAMKIDVIEKNYTDFIVMPKHKKVIERKVFTNGEIALLWDNVKVLDYADTILILIYTGMRINELLKLKKKNVNLENNTITGGSKTDAGKNRIIPIHPKILPLIVNRLGNKTDYLIPNKKGSGAYIYNNFRQNEFIKIMEQLGMEHTVHDTRHTFATLISNVSNNETAITGIIGHTNISMTKKYTHTNIEEMRKEMEKIN